MPSITGGELHIGVARSAVALLHQGHWPRRRSTILGESSCASEPAELSDRPEPLLATLDALLGASACRARAARVVLADDWTRTWMVTPPGNGSRLADCQAAASARFQTLYGESTSGWQLTADWQARTPFLACALPLPLLSGLQQVAAQHRLVLLEVVPHFVAAWNRWHRRLLPGAWFGVVHDDDVVLAAVAGHGLQVLRPVRRTVDADAAWLRLTVEREAMRCVLPVPPGIVLCGDVPASWSDPGAVGWFCTHLETPMAANVGPSQVEREPRLARLLAATGAR